MDSLKKIPVTFASPPTNGDEFMPYQRDEKLSRPWAIPGTPGLMHRIGGLEKQDVTGNVCYDPDNHQHTIKLRQQKVDNVAQSIPEQEVDGPDSGKVLVVSWGGTYGACATAVHEVQAAGGAVAHAHLRWLNPFPRNLGDLFKRYEKILIPELNLGQLRSIIRSEYRIDPEGLNEVRGKPFAVNQIVAKIKGMLD